MVDIYAIIMEMENDLYLENGKWKIIMENGKFFVKVPFL